MPDEGGVWNDILWTIVLGKVFASAGSWLWGRLFGRAAAGEAAAVVEDTAIVGRSVGAQEGIFRGTKITNELARELNVPRRQLGKVVERIKKAYGLRGDENVAIGRASGDVFDPQTGEYLANVFDELPFVK
jgi:hypothetical protein